MAPRCSVLGCSCKGPNGEILKRYRFPKDKTARDRWIVLCGSPPWVSPEHRVCERHFSPKQLLRNPKHKLGTPRGTRRVLKPEAVPDVNLPVIKHEITVKPNDTTMSPSFTKCVPLSVKLKILDDQEKGFGPKKIMKKYKVKKSAYYRILSEKEMIRDYVEKGGSVEFKPKPEKDDNDHEVDALESIDHKDKENSDDDDGDSNYSGSSGMKGMRVLRIQDQITAFQRLQAGETAGQIAGDMGVSRQTIQRVKKRLKDTLFTPTTDQKYHISVESTKTRYKSENAVKEDAGIESNKESVLAAIERRKQLKNKNALSRKDRSLTDNEKIEAVAQCKAGVPLKQIAHNFGVSPSTIQRVKRKFSQSHQLQFKNYMRLEQKVRVLERLEEGETIMEIAEDLGVHDTTIRAIKKSRIKIMNVYRAGHKSVSAASSKVPKVNKYEKMERKLVAWINNLKRWDIPMSTAMIQKKALMIHMQIAQEEGGSSTQSFLPTKEWLADFKRRNNIQKFSHEESDSGSEADELMVSRAAPKCKKKYFASKREGGGPAIASKDTPLPHTENMTLSKFAEGLREMFLSRSLPADPYRCNAFTPRVILSCVEPRLVEKHTVPDVVKTEPPSDEETWLTAHTNAGSDSDWTEQNWDANSLTEISSRSRESLGRKRKNSKSEFNRKRRRLTEDESDEDGSVVDYSRNNFIDVSIKQEPQSSVNSISPNVPMAVLPAGSTYVPPLPMFQMPTTGLTVFMPESQQMMMQHPVGYPHDNASDMFMNQQQLRGRTIDNNASDQYNDIHSEVNVEPSIRQDNENIIVMPFGRDIHEPEKSKQLPSSEPDSVSDALAEKARKERAAAIAENIGINMEGSSHKKLRDLTFKLLELNNKNLICDDRIDKAREEYEKTVAHIEAEKRINDKEIDKVLSAIQEWKEAKSNTTV